MRKISVRVKSKKSMLFFLVEMKQEFLYFVFCLQVKKLSETGNSLVPIGLTFSFSLPERFWDWVGAFFYILYSGTKANINVD